MADNTETPKVDAEANTAIQAETPATEAPQASSPNPSPQPQPVPAGGPQSEAPRLDPPKASAPPRVEPAQPAAPTRSQIVGVALLNAVERLLKWTVSQLVKPKVRLVVVGAILIIVGVWFINHSVWTFPLVIIGIVMIIVAWVGSRLEGRFAIEWNDGGAGFDMRARIKPRAAELPAAVVTSTHSGPVTTVHTAPADVEDAVEVIEGEAHTIEIDVEELRALVEAAERGATANSSANSASTANVTHVSFQGSSDGVDRGVNGAGG